MRRWPGAGSGRPGQPAGQLHNPRGMMNSSSSKNKSGEGSEVTDVVRKRTDYCFSCHQSPKNVSVSLWDVETGTTQRTYSCETGSVSEGGEGKAVSIALLGSSYLFCAPQTVPFIYVWNLKKAGEQIKLCNCILSLACFDNH